MVTIGRQASPLLTRWRCGPGPTRSACGRKGTAALEAALLREMREETGLVVSVGGLLYVAERPEDGLLVITFAVRGAGGGLRLPDNEHDASPISDVRFVPIDCLPAYGDSQTWRDLAAAGLPDAPAHVGPKSAIGL
jgi:8-oxo-dGTP pyrophosphatase MutT (NUDIX family)